MHGLDARKRSILADDFGGRSFHGSILIARQWRGEYPAAAAAPSGASITWTPHLLGGLGRR
jgi:hypothetical protein